MDYLSIETFLEFPQFYPHEYGNPFYGMLASGSCLLTDVVDQLHEKSHKVNSVERLTRHLKKGVPQKALKSYLSFVRRQAPHEPVIHIDGSDITFIFFPHRII